MKKMRKKGIITLFLIIISISTMPIFAFAEQSTENPKNENDGQDLGMYKGFTGGFGAIFNDNNMGEGGDIIGTIFQMLLMQTLDLDSAEMLEGVYVLHASQERVFEGSRNFGENKEIQMLPWLDMNGDGRNDYNTSKIEGYSYCLVETQGGVDYELKVGISLTLALWDHDGSFVEAVKKVIDFGKEIAESENPDQDEELIKKGAELVTWFLIHINDIFTGDELFVLSPFSYQSIKISPWKNMSIKKTWKQTGKDSKLDPKNDTDIATDILNNWRGVANYVEDSTMQWLLNNFNEVDLQETLYTQFTFDILQLWIRNFHIEIDAAALLTEQEEEVNPAEIFKGCDIEFFMFSHHLGGIFLYDDRNADKRPTVNYAPPKDKDGNPVVVRDEDGNVIQNVEVPQSSEISHQLILGEADFSFSEPKIDNQEKKVSWGIDLSNPEIIPVPMGVNLDNYLGAEVEKLDFIHFGLEFIIPKDSELVDEDNDGLLDARARIKLQHDFGPWNDNENPAPKNNIDDLDLSIVYISSVLHYHLQVENNVLKSEDPDAYLQADKKTNDYVNENKTLQIGNYISGNATEKIDFVDIGGENYSLGIEGNTEIKEPTTAVIPLGLWTGEHQSHTTNYGEEDTFEDDFTSDVSAEADHSVMLYAVCYPDFDGTGKGIWHDPTFSVYMAFDPGTAIFWALILLVGGVGFVGIATILITRRKNRMY